MTLNEVKVGETAKVVRLHGEGAVKRRIMDMGLTKGTAPAPTTPTGAGAATIRGISTAVLHSACRSDGHLSFCLKTRGRPLLPSAFLLLCSEFRQCYAA